MPHAGDPARPPSGSGTVSFLVVEGTRSAK
jgi:hypothetical protein